jgi:hypothetical protein
MGVTAMVSDDDEYAHQEQDVCRGLELGCLEHGLTWLDTRNQRRMPLETAFREAWQTWPCRQQFYWVDQIVRGQFIVGYPPGTRPYGTTGCWPWSYASAPWPRTHSQDTRTSEQQRL